MRVLLLGANGLIGHKLFNKLSQSGLETIGTIRRDKRDFDCYPFMQSENIIDNFEIDGVSVVAKLIRDTKPSVVINCIGITKRKHELTDPVKAIGINALFPHQLAQLCQKQHIRMIHFSTDCVFSGDSGYYTEDSIPDASDIYGRTKALGEVAHMDNCLTLRSSFIGTEICDKTELLEWFLAQEQKQIKGYTKAMYSGVSTSYLCRVVIDILQNHPALAGLYQLAPDVPVSKYELLCLAKKAFGLDVEIVVEDSFVADKSLSGVRLKKVMDLEIPSWEAMLNELAIEDADNRKYNINIMECL